MLDFITPVPKCVHCGSETALFVSGMPVCMICDLSPEKTLELLRARVRLGTARAKWKSAKSEASKVDGVNACQPIGHSEETIELQQANASLSHAGHEVKAALQEYRKIGRKKDQTGEQ